MNDTIFGSPKCLKVASSLFCQRRPFTLKLQAGLPTRLENGCASYSVAMSEMFCCERALTMYTTCSSW